LQERFRNAILVKLRVVAKWFVSGLLSLPEISEPGVRQALSALFERTIQLQGEGQSSSRFDAGISPASAAAAAKYDLSQSLALQGELRARAVSDLAAYAQSGDVAEG
jgi:hypothetical protein